MAGEHGPHAHGHAKVDLPVGVFRDKSIREAITIYLGAGRRKQTNKEIAVQLDISNQTVKNHVSSILRKLAVNDRTQAVVYAMRRGWIKVVLPGD